MASAIMRHLVGNRVYVRSAGVYAGAVDGFAVAVMNEIGIDISEHRPHTVEELGDTSFDLIVALSPEAHEHALELTRTMAIEVEHWRTLDPSMMVGSDGREQILSQYRAVRDDLLHAVKRRFDLGGGPTV